MINLTRKQRLALFKVWLRTQPDHIPTLYADVYSGSTTKVVFVRHSLRRSYRDFRKTILPCFDGTGCVLVQHAGMWLGIERDGYTHS